MSPLARAPDRHERLFVGAAWAALSAALFGYILRYGADVPWMDDWELVPVLSGARPGTLRWLWIQQNEHRFPVTKLLFLAFAFVTGGDYRAGMMASAAVLSAVALAATRLAARLRGQANYTDAVFPLLLLHPGHGHNVLGHIQLFFVSACALAIAFALLVAGGRWKTNPRSAAAGAACLLLLPLHSAAGALLTPVPALWALLAARQSWRAPERERGRAARLLFVGAVGGLVLTALYFVGFARPAHHPPSPSVIASVRGGLEVLSVSLGPFGAAIWPWSGAAVALLVAATVLLLLAAVRAHPTERTRALGLLAAMAAVLATVAAMGIGRAGFGPGSGLQARYALPGAPLLVAVYLAWLLYGGRAARLPQVALFAAGCAAFSLNVQDALVYGRARRAQADRLLDDVRAGVLPRALANRHWRGFYPFPAIMARRLRMLEDAGQGPYRSRGSAPPRAACDRWEATDPRRIGGHNMAWADGVGRPEGPDPYLVLGLADPKRLCAVRLTFVHQSAARGDAPLKVYWALASAGGFGEERHWETTIASSAEPQTVVVWTNDEVDLLRVDPDEATTHFRLTGLELLSGT
jgi:hypothetical protein